MADLIRKYRDRVTGGSLNTYRVSIKESDLFISTEGKYIEESLNFLTSARRKLETYIKKNPSFKKSTVPLKISDNMPDIVKKMTMASLRCEVGPMAAVAGAVAGYVGKKLEKYSGEVIVENGGDIFLKLKRERVSAIYAGDSPLNMKIGVKLPPKKESYGLCTSSGTVGHSDSGGNADAVICMGKDTPLSDAAATRICNSVINPDDIQKGLDLSKKIDGIKGCLIIFNDKMGAVGDIEICNLSQMK
ncbi:MAG: UPF0280 family protein [Elusimicrobiota bacterium]